MSLRPTNRIELARRHKIVADVERLFLRDAEDLLMTERDRSALRVCIRIAAESDAEFQRILTGQGKIEWSDDVDYLCDSIESGVEFFAAFKGLAGSITGFEVERPLPTDSLRRLLRQHHRDFRQLVLARPKFAERASRLMRLIKIELIFWGRMW